ncbi:site-specific integrase [Denitratimonas sp. CY0512]|uniref:site-specific integrase n=1 Tax=Denitratimonas sp. CY0512 TaxID=3131940 RepID=UPI0030AD21B6
MANIRTRRETGCLFLDFRYRGVRCREQTALQDTPANRRTLESLANRIKRELAKGTFDYALFFPDSPRAAQFAAPQTASPRSEARADSSTSLPASTGPVPTFGEFAETWFDENKPRWRDTHAETIRGTLDQHILPAFRARQLGEITRADLLAFRGELGKLAKKNGDTLSPSRINHIMTPLRMLLAEASERYEFVTPFRNIKPLRLPKLDIQPFSLEEVHRILDTVRKDWQPYLAVRFFTGMRTGEVNGLEWKHIDFDQDLILVRQTIVKGKLENTKTDGSMRDIPMVPAIRAALLEQRKLVPEDCPWVFAQRNGEPISLVNFTNRIWHPLLRHVGLTRRRPYQTRHTAATLMLGSGENPEWVARMLGHANTEMLFRVYSRYVPNLTRNDGRAFTGLVSAGAAIRPGTPAPEGTLPASLTMLSRPQLEALVRSLSGQSKEDHSHGD